MKSIFGFLLTILAFAPQNVTSQSIDTLIDVGGYHLHFKIIKGNGIPILFESGAGNDASVWDQILGPIAAKTSATLICYDRAGFGQSEIDTNRHTIVNGVEALEIGLRTLGYNGNILLVAHSYGGFYAHLFASRNSGKVNAALLIDANQVGYFTDDYIRNSILPVKEEIEKVKKDYWGLYFIYADFHQTINLMRKIDFPSLIPVIDIVSDKTPCENSYDSLRWKLSHRQFVDSSPNRKGIIANGCGHYIFQENPELVIDEIVKLYADYRYK
jgi:pimeloyl-ACP methyl ester carboxylesterase